MKHLEIDNYFIIEKIDTREPVLPYVKSVDQLADVFIKDLFIVELKNNINKLGIFDIYIQLEGNVKLC